MNFYYEVYKLGNSFWYILLCILSLILFTYTLWHRWDKKLIAIYFFIAGVTYFLEYFVVVIFEGYVYRPMILEDKYFDNVLGAIASDGFVIPMTAVYVAAYKLNFKIRLGIVLFITLIEVFFVRFNLYEHYWWKYLYTILGGTFIYFLAQKWYSKLNSPISHFTRYITLFFADIAIQASTVFILASIFNMFFYNIDWYANPSRGHIAFATLYIIFISSILVTLVIFRLNWVWYIASLAILSLIDVLLLKMNILIPNENWSLIYFPLYRIFNLAYITLFNKYLLTDR